MQPGWKRALKADAGGLFRGPHAVWLRYRSVFLTAVCVVLFTLTAWALGVSVVPVAQFAGWIRGDAVLGQT